MEKGINVAVVGATGLVGQKILQVLQERAFPINELIPVASEKSVGKNITFNGKTYPIIGIQEAISMRPQLALFSAGGEISLQWAPEFVKTGTTVIDNSSTWRMDPSKKLIIPEINAHELTRDDKLIANPNCSTIQLLMVLAPLHKKFGIRRVIVSTYQSITGTGYKAVHQLEEERAGREVERAYHHSIDLNCIPQCDSFESNGYTKEEMKLINETKKILADDTIRLTATAVRVPVIGGHSESVNIELMQDIDISEIRSLLNQSTGVIVQDQPEANFYPMPIWAKERDEVFVGRIRKDFSMKNALNLWIVSDNLRKGAATNAVQIAEYLRLQNWI